MMGEKARVVLLVFLFMFAIVGLTFALGARVARPLAECGDHLDNDGDGYCDFSVRKAYCNDGSIVGDADCSAKTDTSEAATCNIACSSAGECGTNSYGSPYCGTDGNLYRDYTFFSCINPGSCNSLCDSSTSPELYQTCLSGCLNGKCNSQSNDSSPKQVVFIGVDGMQNNHYNEMLASGKLPHFTQAINNGGWSGSAEITGHARTETAPGNAELHSGLPDSITNIVDNTCGKSLPVGDSEFERLHSFNPSIPLGLVYGKGTCYIPDAVLKNAKSAVVWWFNRTNYPQTTWVSSNCADSRNVANKSLEFIRMHKDESFFLVVYFGAPDCSGHTYGENSQQYDDAFVNVDSGLGIILDGLSQNGVNGKIILSADHGWNEGTTGHGTANADTKILPLVSNDASFVSTVYNGKRKQCDIVPTILSYFGMSPADYQEITNVGCGSMIG